jgi:hypothetical protein
MNPLLHARRRQLNYDPDRVFRGEITRFPVRGLGGEEEILAPPDKGNEAERRIIPLTADSLLYICAGEADLAVDR